MRAWMRTAATAAVLAMLRAAGAEACQTAIRKALHLYREDRPRIPLCCRIVPWAMLAHVGMPHIANNQPSFRQAVAS